MQERQAAKSEAHALQTTVLERDASLQRKDVQVLVFRGIWRPAVLHAAAAMAHFRRGTYVHILTGTGSLIMCRLRRCVQTSVDSIKF